MIFDQFDYWLIFWIYDQVMRFFVKLWKFPSWKTYVSGFRKHKGGSRYDKLRALKTGEGALCPKYCPILMKIGKQVGFYVYYSYNWGPRNFDKN